jgi:hypothetical protein
MTNHEMEKNQGNLIIKQIKACPDFSGVQIIVNMVEFDHFKPFEFEGFRKLK